MNTNLSTTKTIARANNCNHYSVVAARTVGVISLIAFAALTFLGGNLGNASQLLHNKLSIGSLASLGVIAGSEIIANCCKRFEIFPVYKILHFPIGVYEGECKNGKPHGEGVYTINEHKTTEGVFKGLDSGHLPRCIKEKEPSGNKQFSASVFKSLSQ